jgi:oxygen-independent coproporphyrinogen-3 oxidase
MGLSLYIHYPFCGNLCDYCDFYKIRRVPEMERRFFSALSKELQLAAASLSDHNRVIETIYIGGGTPSLVPMQYMENLLAQLKELLAFSEELEFSIEINPESIDGERLHFLKNIGVNRPIFGIQSFNPRLLKILNRVHRIDESFRAAYLARAAGFKNFGVDMIFGLPRQTTADLADDLAQLAELAPPHVSYYQLTVEKNTGMAEKVRKGKIKLPDSDLCAAMYRAINVELAAQKYIRYEISSFAHSGYECRHNKRYWEGGDFLGLGPSAHSFIENRRFANVADLETYIDGLEKFERPIIFDSNAIQDRVHETIMLRLRTSKGIGREDFRRQFGIDLEQVVDAASLRVLIESGYVDFAGDTLRLTESGFPLADEIIRRLVK